MKRALATGLAVVCFGVGLTGCEPTGEGLVRECAECMADGNSALHRRIASGETGVIPLSVAGVEAEVRAQLERGELTMAEIEETYARFCQ